MVISLFDLKYHLFSLYSFSLTRGLSSLLTEKTKQNFVFCIVLFFTDLSYLNTKFLIIYEKLHIHMCFNHMLTHRGKVMNRRIYLIVWKTSVNILVRSEVRKLQLTCQIWLVSYFCMTLPLHLTLHEYSFLALRNP